MRHITITRREWQQQSYYYGMLTLLLIFTYYGATLFFFLHSLIFAILRYGHYMLPADCCHTRHC